MESGFYWYVIVVIVCLLFVYVLMCDMCWYLCIDVEFV